MLVKAAEQGGAVGIRANSVRDIKEIKGGYKSSNHWDNKTRLSTARTLHHCYMKEVDELAELDIEVIALDCTKRERYDGLEIQEFIRQVKEKYPNQLLMADTSTFEEGLAAVEAGIDFVGTTLSGYTSYSPKVDGPDFELIKKLCDAGVDVIAEGKFIHLNKPNKSWDMECEVSLLVALLLDQKEITERFVAGLK